MKNAWIFIQTVYKWHTNELIFLLVAPILAWSLIQIMPVLDELEQLIILWLGIQSFLFSRKSFVLPRWHVNLGSFSWKYIQGLPLNKKEVMLIYIGSTIVSLLPFTVLTLTFHQDIFSFFEDKKMIIETGTFIKIIFGLLPFLIFLGISSIAGLINAVRYQFLLPNKKLIWLNNIKNVLLITTVIYYGCLGLYHLAINFEVAAWLIHLIMEVVDVFLRALAQILDSWLLVPLLFGLVYLYYKRTEEKWLNEKVSYKKTQWHPARDKTILGLCSFLLLIPVMENKDKHQAKHKEIYADAPLLNWIEDGDMTKIVTLKMDGVDAQSPNKYGVTPLMAAALEGRWEIFKVLEKLHDPTTKGEVSFPGSPYHGMNILLLAIKSGNDQIVSELLKRGLDPNTVNSKTNTSALHLASLRCYPQIVRSLLAKKANIKTKDRKGRTALHAAAYSECTKVGIELVESGINPMEKDNKKRTALDYLNGQGPEKKQPKDKSIAQTKAPILQYYLEKKMRLPASIGN